MKPLLFLAALVCTLSTLHSADSKRTAEYIMSLPQDHEGKTVSLDVAMVSPVHWKSPLPEIAFFHAVTIDKRNYRHGGNILVAIPSTDAEKFIKKYGTSFKHRGESDSMKGEFLALPVPRAPVRKFWYIDLTEGQLTSLIAQRKVEFEEKSLSDAGVGAPRGALGNRLGRSTP